MNSHLTVDYNGGTEGRRGYASVTLSWRKGVANLRSRCGIFCDKVLGLEDAAV